MDRAEDALWRRPLRRTLVRFSLTRHLNHQDTKSQGNTKSFLLVEIVVHKFFVAHCAPGVFVVQHLCVSPCRCVSVVQVNYKL